MLLPTLTLALALAAATEYAARALRRRAPSAIDAPLEPDTPPGWRAALALVLCAVAAARLWSIARVATGGNEFIALIRARAASLDDAPGDLAHLLHAPLHGLLSRRWLGLVDALSLPPTMAWVRAPAVPLSALVALLLARLGRRLDAPWAGLGAACLYAASPLMIQVHAYQENYLLELLSALCFCERAAEYAFGRRPVQRQVAVAAAFAAWSGYMNLPLLGLGAAGLAVVASRRRDAAGAALALGWALALTTPLAPFAAAAVRGLTALTRAGNAGLGAAPGLSEALSHEVMPIAQAYGHGSLRALSEGLLEVALGPAGAVALVGAALALVARPRAAWLPLAAVAVTVVAGTRMSMRLQNFAPVVTALLFLTCWGAELAVAQALPRGSRAARALAPLTVAALVAALAPVTLRRWPPLRENPHFLPYYDLSTFRRALASIPADTPVMLYGERTPDMHGAELCAGEAPLSAFVRCVERARSPVDPSPWAVHRVRRREVAAPRAELQSPSIPVPLAPALPELTARPAWRRGFLVYRGTNPFSDSDPARELDVILEGRCARVASAVGYRIARCPPDVTAPAAPPSPSAPTP